MVKCSESRWTNEGIGVGAVSAAMVRVTQVKSHWKQTVVCFKVKADGTQQYPARGTKLTLTYLHQRRRGQVGSTTTHVSSSVMVPHRLIPSQPNHRKGAEVLAHVDRQQLSPPAVHFVRELHQALPHPDPFHFYVNHKDKKKEERR